MRTALIFALALGYAAPASAQTLMDKIKKGAGDAAHAVGKGTEKVGEAVSKGAEAVENTIKSTNELVRDEETPAQTRVKLDEMADGVLERLLDENADASLAFDLSAGYAVFDMRRVTIFPLSAGYGRGVAISKDTGEETYMQMGTGGVGAAFGIGGFASQFVILFETPLDFERFVENGYDASADAGAMQGEDRTKEEVQFSDGRSFFVLGKTGWRVNANASGTRYWPDADLNDLPGDTPLPE